MLPFDKFPSLLLPRNGIVLQYIIIKFSFICMSTGGLQEVKNKEKFNLLALKVLAVAYERCCRAAV